MWHADDERVWNGLSLEPAVRRLSEWVVGEREGLYAEKIDEQRRIDRWVVVATDGWGRTTPSVLPRDSN